MTALLTWSHTDAAYALWSGLLILVLAPQYAMRLDARHRPTGPADSGQFDIP